VEFDKSAWMADLGVGFAGGAPPTKIRSTGMSAPATGSFVFVCRERVANHSLAFITPLRARSKADRAGRHLEQFSADDKTSSGHFCLSIGARVIAHPATGVA